MTAAKIPRRIAFFWHGGPLSFCRYLTLLSFRRLHPSWEMRLYSPTSPPGGRSLESRERQDFHSYSGLDYADRLWRLDIGRYLWLVPPPLAGLDPVKQSDFFQWHWLGGEGGYYCDMDVLWVRPIDDLHDTYCRTAKTVVCFTTKNMAIGFLASAIEAGSVNRFFLDVYSTAYKMALHCDGKADYQSAGTLAVSRLLNLDNEAGFVKDTRPKSFEGRYADAYPDLPLHQLHPWTVYPWTWQRVAMIWRCLRTQLEPEVRGIHWYAWAPMSQRMNCRITENNFLDNSMRCTWTYWAQKVIDGA